jgi:hypothetical protein
VEKKETMKHFNPQCKKEKGLRMANDARNQNILR